MMDKIQPITTLGKFAGYTLLTLIISVSGCAAPEDMDIGSVKVKFGSHHLEGDDSAPVIMGPDEITSQALAKFNHGQYASALKKFKEIENRFPFSRYSMLAELKSADCNYYLKKYEKAIELYQKFLKEHPTNEAAPYVMFQIAMSYYQQIGTVDRDPGSASNAEAAFNKLLRVYPDSAYSQEAKARTKAARNFLANHEMYVASFYLKTKKHSQSIHRLEYLLDYYPETQIVPEAEELLAILQAGQVPKGSWRDWIPQIGLPDWTIFDSFKVAP